LRDELGKKDVVFDADLLLTPKAVVSRIRSTGADGGEQRTDIGVSPRLSMIATVGLASRPSRSRVST
jgi:hypothetical protein